MFDHFLRPVLQLSTGTAIAQAIGLLSLPIISRLYDPTSFGLFVVMLSYGGAIATIAAFRYELAIPIPVNQSDYITLLRLCAWLCICISLLAGVALTGLAQLGLSQFPRLSIFPSICVETIAAATATSLFATLSQSAVRLQKFRVIGTTKIAIAILMLVAQVFLSNDAPNNTGLLHGYVFAYCFGVVILAKSVIPGPVSFWQAPREILATARRYKAFPGASLPGAICESIAGIVPITAFTLLYSIEAAAQFGMADRLIRVPSAILGLAISQVLYSKLCRITHDPRDRTHLLLAVAWRSAVTGALCALALMLLGEWLFAMVFGNKWTEAGRMAETMGIIVLFQFAASTISVALVADGRLRTLAAWQFTRMVTLVVAAMLAAGISLSIDMFVVTYTVVETTLYAIYAALTLAPALRFRRTNVR